MTATTMDQRNAQLTGVTSALDATELRRNDDGWHDWRIVALTEPAIALWLSYHSDRKGDYLTASVDWPKDHAGNAVMARDVDYKAVSPTVRMSASKSADAIAREIRRRLLPDALPLYEKAVAICCARAAYKHSEAENWKALSAAAGIPLRHYRDKCDIYPLPEGVHIAHVSDDSVRMELTLTIGEACAVLHQRRALDAAKTKEQA